MTPTNRLRALFALPVATVLAAATCAASAHAEPPPSEEYQYSSHTGHYYVLRNPDSNRCYRLAEDAYNGGNYTARTAKIYSDTACQDKVGEAAPNGGQWGGHTTDHSNSVKFCTAAIC
jgi:hypothetical protein